MTSTTRRERRTLHCVILIWTGLLLWILAACTPITDPNADPIGDTMGETMGGETTGDFAALDPPEKVTVAYIPIMKFATLYVAAERGLFETYGLDVEIESIASGSEVIDSLLANALDVGGIAIVTPLWNSWHQGNEIRVFAPGALEPFEDSPTKLIAATRLVESGEVEAAGDLAGKTVAIAGGAGSGAEYLLSKALERGKFTIGDVEMVNVGNQDARAAFEDGTIDAALLGSPFADEVINAEYGVAIESDLTPGLMTVAFVGSGNFVNERPEVAQRFVLALTVAARLMQGDAYLDAENIAAYLNFINADENTIRTGHAVIYDPNMHIPVEGLADIEKTHRENGRIESDQPIDLANVVITAFTGAAVAHLGEAEMIPPITEEE